MSSTNETFWSDLQEAGLGIGEENVHELLGPARTLADILGNDYESMFRQDHDVVLLSFGFKYGMSGDTMHKTHKDKHWSVDLTRALPVWYCDNKRIGGMTYDAVVNLFKVS